MIDSLHPTVRSPKRSRMIPFADSDIPNTPGGAGSSSGNTPERHILRVIAVGSPTAVNHHVMQMYQLRYAEPYEWSETLPTVNPNEVMRILTKRIMSSSN